MQVLNRGAVALMVLVISATSFGLDLKMPLPPEMGAWKIGSNEPYHHPNAPSHNNVMGFDLSDLGREGGAPKVLAAADGRVKRIVHGVCFEVDGEIRDVCPDCAAADADFSVSYADTGLPGTFGSQPSCTYHTTPGDTAYPLGEFCRGGGYGNRIEIEHPIDANSSVVTLYAHLRCNSIPEDLVVGADVVGGQELGTIGTTGHSWGSHLHFEVQYCQYGVCNPTDVNSLREVSLEGILFSDHLDSTLGEGPFAAGEWIDSTNYIQVEFLNLELDGLLPSLTFFDPNTVSLTFTLEAVNHRTNDVTLSAINVFRRLPGGGAPEPVGTYPVNVLVPAAAVPGGSGPVVALPSQVFPLEIPDNTVGPVEISFTYDMVPAGEQAIFGVGTPVRGSVFAVTHPEAVIIDNDDGAFNRSQSGSGSGFESRTVGGYDGNSSLLASTDAEELWAQWRPDSLPFGRYEVWVYVPAGSTNTNATYMVSFGHLEYVASPPSPDECEGNLCITKVDRARITVDQSAVAGGASGWVNLGRYLMKGSEEGEPKNLNRGNVRLFAMTVDGLPAGQTGFDAVVLRPVASIQQFDDVDQSDWFFLAVRQLRQRGIVSGLGGSNNFAPHQPVTRAEFTKMVLLAAQSWGRSEILDLLQQASTSADLVNIMSGLYLDAGIAYPPFTDVDEPTAEYDIDDASWFYRYVLTSRLFGLVCGQGGNPTFDPNGEITRAEAVKVLLNALHADSSNPLYWTALPFVDIDSVPWAHPYLKFAYAQSIAQGYSDSTFAPNQSMTRAEAAKMIWRAARKNLPTIAVDIYDLQEECP